MWPKLFNTPVTIISRLDARDFGLPSDTYIKHVFNGCSWVDTTLYNVTSSGVALYSTDTTVRVPIDSIEAAGVTIVDRQGLIDAPDKTKVIYPRPDCYLLKGDVDVDTSSLSAIRDAVDAAEPYSFTASEAKVNDDIGLAHIKFRG